MTAGGGCWEGSEPGESSAHLAGVCCWTALSILCWWEAGEKTHPSAVRRLCLAQAAANSPVCRCWCWAGSELWLARGWALLCLGCRWGDVCALDVRTGGGDSWRCLLHSQNRSRTRLRLSASVSFQFVLPFLSFFSPPVSWFRGKQVHCSTSLVHGRADEQLVPGHCGVLRPLWPGQHSVFRCYARELACFFFSSTFFNSDR